MNTKRREIINSLLQDKGIVKLDELEKMFPEVSTMTLRRDLIFLEDKGLAIRVRGGARASRQMGSLTEDIYNVRAILQIEKKKEIAKKAVNFIETGRAIYFDAGTTLMSLATILPETSLSVITNAPNIAMEVSKNSKTSITMIGGILNRDHLSVSGMQCLDMISSVNIDVAFMAASAYSKSGGFTSGIYNEATLKKEVIKKARTTVMLMDSSKIGKTLPFTFADVTDIDVLVTDSDIPEDLVSYFLSQNTKVVF